MDILQTIGNTPLVKVTSVNGNDIFAKLEYFNPGGSVKDRTALYMINGAIERGELKKGGVIVEPTSGNTGIGLALIGQAKGFKVIVTMPENMSAERIAIIRSLGAEVVLTAKADGMNGAVTYAKNIIAQTTGAYMPMQFSNPDGAKAHYCGTAPEIFGACNADVVIAGVGSGGTAVGIKRYIKDNGLKSQVYAVQPSESPLLTGGNAAPHGIQGIGANFVPELFKSEKPDGILSVSTAQSKTGVVELASYGVLAGFSSGAAYSAAKEFAASVTGKNIVFIAPDTSLRYLSMGIYE